jgi:hypothetical protein
MTMRLAACLASIGLLIQIPATHAALRGDTLELKNGDRLTGEVTKLEYGKLRFKTDYLGTLSVEWAGVRSLTSKQTFDVEAVTGQRHFGVLTTSTQGWLVITDPGGTVIVPFADVARIAPLERKFWERVNGSLSAGYDYANSSRVSVVSVHFDATYRAALNTLSLRIDSNSTTSPEEGTVDRQRVAVTYQRARPGARFRAGIASFDRNQELGVDGRLQAGAAFGRHLFQSSVAEVSTLVGAVVNQEWVTGNESNRQNVEGLLAGSWRVFRFTAPETSLAFSAVLFPSLTESGRYRASVDTSLRREVIENFFVDLSFWYDYDSLPPSDAAAKDDFGITTSLGYSF